MSATFATLCVLDDALAAEGFHRMTPWWRPVMDRYYSHPTARTLIGRVGRGGSKSFMSSKVALNELIHGDWTVPRGEVHFWAFVSASKDEAAQRIRLLSAMLTALGIDFQQEGDQLIIPELRRGLRVFACQVGAVSGFRCFGFSADELAKWRSKNELANPAGEVIASLNAMAVTHPGARRLLISSPLGMEDHHYQRFQLGDTADQIVAEAPSWIANPDGITKEQTERDEPDRRVWLREYAAIPQHSISAAFDADLIDRCFRPVPSEAEFFQSTGFIDSAAGKSIGSDQMTYGAACYALMPRPDPYLRGPVPTTVHTAVRGKPVVITRNEGRIDVLRDEQGRPLPNPEALLPRKRALVFRFVDGFSGAFGGQLVSGELYTKIMTRFRRIGVTTIYGDQYGAAFTGNQAIAHGLFYKELAWQNRTKAEAVSRVRQLLSDGSLILPRHERLKAELLAYTEKITGSGTITYGARGSGKDDHVALLLNAAMAELEHGLPGSPLRDFAGKTIVSR